VQSGSGLQGHQSHRRPHQPHRRLSQSPGHSRPQLSIHGLQPASAARLSNFRCGFICNSGFVHRALLPLRCAPLRRQPPALAPLPAGLLSVNAALFADRAGLEDWQRSYAHYDMYPPNVACQATGAGRHPCGAAETPPILGEMPEKYATGAAANTSIPVNQCQPALSPVALVYGTCNKFATVRLLRNALLHRKRPSPSIFSKGKSQVDGAKTMPQRAYSLVFLLLAINSNVIPVLPQLSASTGCVVSGRQQRLARLTRDTYA
jgi:hypothetical protein